MGERELTAILREEGWLGARRGQQRSGVDTSDVIDGPRGWHLEVKRVEKLNVWAAMAQAERDAGLELLPMVACRRDRGDWLAVLDLRTLLRMMRRLGL